MCNRFKSILVSNVLAKISDRRVLYSWPRNKDCGAGILSLLDVSSTKHSRFGNSYTLKFPGIDVEPERLLPAELKPGLCVLDRQWQYITESQLRYILNTYDVTVQDVIRPRTELISEARELKASWSSDYVGVHFRRGDFHLMDGWIAHAERYVQAIEHVDNAIGKILPIFLATDATEGELDALKQSFPNRLIRRPPVDRLSDRGVQNAMIDWLLLSGAPR